MVISNRIADMALKRKSLMKELNNLEDVDGEGYSQLTQELQMIELIMRSAYRESPSETAYALAYGAGALPDDTDARIDAADGGAGLYDSTFYYAEEVMFYALGVRTDALKGGKGGKKKRTEKPKCTKGRSCGMSCIPQNRKCKSDLSPAADVVAKSVAASGGGGMSRSRGKAQPKAINLDPLGAKIKDTYLANARGLNNIGDVFKPGADSIESNVAPDPKMVAAFRKGQKNGTLAMMRFNEQENVVPADPVSAVIMASAKAAGVGVNGIIVRNEDSGLAAVLHKVNGAPLMTAEGRGTGMNSIGGMQRVTASEIAPGKITASQRDIDAAARAIREQGGRALLPIPVREAKDGSGYSVVGDGNLLAVAQRANVDPWIYIVDDE